MDAELSANTQAVLLLTAPLSIGRGRGAGPPEPLAEGEWRRLARRLHERGREPADLIGADAARTLAACAPARDHDRLERLLGRGFLLAQALERWRSRGIWTVGRADEGYPRRLKARLGAAAPPALWGFGDRAALEAGGLAVVGSRNAGDDLLARAENAGGLAAGARRALVSGGARGVDRAAMRGALEAGGRAVGVLADGLERAVVRRGDREALMDGRLVLVCPFDPAARFQVWRAMARNKLIYALADAALVVSADLGKGGTWAGAVEQLEKFRRAAIYVRPAGAAEPGLAALRERGARTWPDPDGSDALAGLLDAAAADEGMADAVRDASPPGLAESPAERGAGPAGALFARALELLARACAGEPKSAAEVAGALGIRQTQAGDWLARAVAEGALEKLPRPVRYRAIESGAAPRPAGGLLEAVEDLAARTCADAPKSEADIAAALGVRRVQARDWLGRMVARGRLERKEAPVRYSAPARRPGPLFAEAAPDAE